MPWKWWVPKALKLTLPEWFVYCTTAYSPIAISLGSYMDKAVGRRACTRKFFTHNVSVLSRWCLGLVSVLSRWCLGLGLSVAWVMSRQCGGMSGWCLGNVSVLSFLAWAMCRELRGDVSVMSGSCLGHVSVVSRSRLGLVSVMSRSWFGVVWVMSRAVRGDVGMMSLCCIRNVSGMTRQCLADALEVMSRNLSCDGVFVLL